MLDNNVLHWLRPKAPQMKIKGMVAGGVEVSNRKGAELFDISNFSSHEDTKGSNEEVDSDVDVSSQTDITFKEHCIPCVVVMKKLQEGDELGTPEMLHQMPLEIPGQEEASVKADDKPSVESNLADDNVSLAPFPFPMVREQLKREEPESAPCVQESMVLDEHAFAEAFFKSGQSLPTAITKEVAARFAKFIVMQAKTAEQKRAVEDFVRDSEGNAMHQQSFTIDAIMLCLACSCKLIKMYFVCMQSLAQRTTFALLLHDLQ